MASKRGFRGLVALISRGAPATFGAARLRAPAAAIGIVAAALAATTDAFAQSNNGNGVPCDALANAVTSTAGNVTVDSSSLVDSYQSSHGAYGGSNVGSAARVQAAASVVNNGGIVDGTEVINAPTDLAVVPVPPGAIDLPLRSTAPGNVNVNGTPDSITLAPGTYVAANVNVSFPGSITISPPGPVEIWVTGSLNLGGYENAGGLPSDLTFFVTSSGWVNVNSSGQLFGTIDAPTSGVNLDSAVFGSVVGSTVTLNSGAAVHYDQSGACPAPAPTVSSSSPLPAPPAAVGCYVGTWNGWLTVPCTPFDQLPPGLQRRPFIGGGEGVIQGYLDGGVNAFGTMPGIQSTDTNDLKFGQVDTTVVDIVPSSSTAPAEQDDCFNLEPGFCGSAPFTTSNTFSIQLNTNPFAATKGPNPFFQGGSDGWVPNDKGWVQFVLASEGSPSHSNIPSNHFAVCLWQIDFTQGKMFTSAANDAYLSSCVGGDGSTFATMGRDLQPFDSASVAGFAFPDSADTSKQDLGIVAQLSWWDPSQAPADYRGLYATVAEDLYGLSESGNWKTISGTLIGVGSGSMAQFNDASIYTQLIAGNCANSTTEGGPVPSSCTSTLSIGSVGASTQQFTDESNNLNVVGTPSPIASTTDDNAESHYVAATGSPAQCDATPHVFVKDYPQDNGSMPSNLNGQAFWESPDIVLVPDGGAATDPPTSTVVAGQDYSIWINVHNDYGCAPASGVTARVFFGDPSLGVTSWQNVVTGTPDFFFETPITVGPFASAPVGPIPWMAPVTADPHECLLAVVKATDEAAPTVTDMTNTPAFNQVAQRNIEVGNDCSWTLKNGATGSGLASITLKTVTGANNDQTYTPQPKDTVQISFADLNGQTFFNSWSPPPPGAGYTVNNANGLTTVQLVSTGFVVLPTISLAASANVAVTSNVIPALFSGTEIDLQISVTLANGGTIPIANGASCQATATQGQPPPK